MPKHTTPKSSKTSKTSKTTTRRGSPEAIAKRRTARALNALLTGPTAGKVDRRVERRRRRLLAELGGKKGLKPIEVVQHANELLEIETPWAEIKRAAGKRHRVPVSDETTKLATDAQKAYGFDLRAWTLLGFRLGKG